MQPLSARQPEVEPSPQRPVAAPSRVLSSEQLLQGARAIEIQHAGRSYRLQVTSRNKLILTA